jgi:hypothetical protein
MRLPLSLATLAGALAILLAGCGGSDSEGGTAPTTTDGDETTLQAPAWAGPLLAKPGPEGALVMATTDFAVGPNRIGFLLIRDNGQVITTPTAILHYGPGKSVVARQVPIGVSTSSSDREEVKSIYVADDVPFRTAGKQFVVVQPKGVEYQGFQQLDVKADPTAIAIGDKAPESDNPTIASKPANRITTANPPDTSLLQYSIKDSVDQHKPFVVAFATPAFCQSRTCGPTVDVVQAVQKQFPNTDIRFIHVEIYEDNLPGNGVNEWVREWKLPSEPWVFVVGKDGIVRDRFEGAISVGELSRSVREHLQ